MIRLHARMMRNGWSIPQSLEWLFWPTGYSPPVPESFEVYVPEGASVELKFQAYRPTLIQRSLVGRFKLTNRDAFLAQLRRLGAVREQKS